MVAGFFTVAVSISRHRFKTDYEQAVTLVREIQASEIRSLHITIEDTGKEITLERDPVNGRLFLGLYRAVSTTEVIGDTIVIRNPGRNFLNVFCGDERFTYDPERILDF